MLLFGKIDQRHVAKQVRVASLLLPFFLSCPKREKMFGQALRKDRIFNLSAEAVPKGDQC